MIKHYQLIFIFLFYCTIGFSQQLPPLESFYPQDYGGGDQNWNITQGEDRKIYIANNKGLLVYNGSKWALYPTPNQSIMRSVLAVGNRVFSGQYNDFGYWSNNRFGQLEYTSLVKEFNLQPLEDEEFWGIASFKEWLVFQSLDRIYILNEKSKRVNIIESSTTLTEMVLVDDTIVFQKMDEGIFSIESGKEKLLTNNPQISSEVMVDAYIKDDTWHILTQTKGVFQLNENQVVKTPNKINSIISSKSIYSGRHLSDGDYALGSISNGLLVFNSSNELKYQFNQSNGLSNNTVLGVFEDMDGNVWLAMDNGISVINRKSQFSVYYDEEGVLGTVYTAAVYKGNLYLGTNQGLFLKNKNGDFKMIPNTEGQVWSLDTINGQLFCGHDRGTFLVSETGVANRISVIQGAWKLKPMPTNSRFLVQGNYNGLYVFENRSGQFVLRNKIEGFDTSARFFEFIDTNTIVVSHEYKGIYKLTVDSNLTQVIKLQKDELPKSVNSSLVKYRDEVYYGAETGIYKYEARQEKFVFDSIASRLMDYSPYVSGKLMTGQYSSKLWYTSRNGISYMKPDNLTGDYKVTNLALPLHKRSTKSGYEHVLELSENSFLLGTTEGYVVAQIDTSVPSTFSVVLDQVETTVLGETPTIVDFNSNSEFETKTNTLKFSFYSPSYETLLEPVFRYRLKGYYSGWSNWSESSEALYENLPPGNYHFEVQAKVGDQLSSNSAGYKFIILKPWYLSTLAIGAYVVFLLILGSVIHSVYRRYYKKQRLRLLLEKEKEMEIRDLESQKQIMQFRNENLKLDVENKSRELGLSTMNLIQKNEVLNDIKNQLAKVSTLKEVKDVVRQINRQLNTTADWKLFEEAFNNADKEFLKSVKTKHPNLTSNDLRLCAYLRLNLSSKEIAPLLNISHKSVEVKRYRLRKKMDLDHEINLTDYILQI